MKKTTLIALVAFVIASVSMVRPAQAGVGDSIRRLAVYDAGIAEFLEERTLSLQPGTNTIEWRSLMPKAMLNTLRVTVEGADILRQDVTYDGADIAGNKTPVLHLVVDNRGAAASRRVLVDYLAPDIDWRSDYTLALEPGTNGAPPTSATLDSWVTMQNRTGADLHAASVDLIAGDINLVGGDAAQYRQLAYQANAQMASYDSSSTEAGVGGAVVSGLSVFTRFSLGRDISLNSNTPLCRFPLFQHARMAVEERKVFENEYSVQTLARGNFVLIPVGLEVRIVTKNTTGAPMPAGTVTIYARSGEFFGIVGQDRVGFTPEGQEFSVSQGRSTTLLGTRRVLERRVDGPSSTDRLVTKIEVVLTNRSSVAAEAYVREGIEQYDDNHWTVLESTHPSERIGSNKLQFKVTVPANGSTTIAYTVENR